MNAVLRVAILTPTALPHITGNAVTAERWRRSLSRKGVAVEVLETQHLGASVLVDRLDLFSPHVVHAHHVIRAGALMLDPRVEQKYGHLPFVVSPAGTDINHFSETSSGRDLVGKTCRKARYLIVQGRETAGRLLELLPDLKERIADVPKSFYWFGSDGFDLRAVAGVSDQDILFFMPAGIRVVKGNLECLSAMEKAHEINGSIRVVFAGPALEASYAGRFAKKIKHLESFAKWISEIPPQAMHSAYGGADVVLNHSVSEGLSNSLLEAMASGRPILASDIPGNRWLALDDTGIGPCGMLFNSGDPADFVRKALLFAGDEAIRETLAANGRLRAAAWPQPEDEAQALIDVYEAAMGKQ